MRSQESLTEGGVLAAQVPRRWQTAERSKTANALIVNYMGLRKTIGIVGLLLPVALFLGAWSVSKSRPSLVLYCNAQLESARVICWQWPESLSGYYFTTTRNVLVGVLFSVGHTRRTYLLRER